MPKLVHAHRPRVAMLVLAWHLLTPPIVYDKAQNKFRAVLDAPIGEWRHEDEFEARGQCLAARAATFANKERGLAESPRDYGAEGLAEAAVESFRNSRCLSDQPLR